MAKATRYIYNEKPKKKLGNIESLPFLSTGDYETDARNNPNNIYIQRQLGLHYENVSNWEGAKDVYLRQIKKHPANPDAHFYLGSFYAQLGEYEKARQSFEEALDTITMIYNPNLLAKRFSLNDIKKAFIEAEKGEGVKYIISPI